MRGRYYKQFECLCSRGVRDLYYRPDFYSNRFLKDDFLFISYHQKIILHQELLKIAGADEHVCGREIIAFLNAAEK